jgi:four helix bundle protein
MARGSLSEVETQILIAQRLGYVKEERLSEFGEIASETGRLINGLINSIEKHVS